MRTTLLLVTLGLALAGCTSDSGDADDSGIAPGPLLADGTAAPLALDITDCSEQMGVFPTNPEDAAGFVPEGFEPVPFDETGTTWVTIAVAFTCTSGDEPVAEFGGGLAVLPPEEYRSENITDYAIVLGWVTDREDHFDTYQAWGGNGSYFLGDVQVDNPAPDNPAFRVGQVRGTTGGSSATMNSGVPAMGPAEEAGVVRLFILDWESMNVTSAIDFSWTDSASGSDSGTGTLAFEGAIGGMFPAVQPGLAFHYWGDYSYHLEYASLW